MIKKIKLTEADLRKIVDNTVKMLKENWHANFMEYYKPQSIQDIIDYYGTSVLNDILDILEKLPQEKKANYIDSLYEYWDDDSERSQTFKEAMDYLKIGSTEMFAELDTTILSSVIANEIYNALIGDDYGYERFAVE